MTFSVMSLVSQKRQRYLPGSDLAFWKFFCHLNGPGPRAVTAIKNSLRLTVSREDQPIIKDHVEDVILELEPLRLVLVMWDVSHGSR